MIRAILAALVCLLLWAPAQADGYHAFGRSIPGAWGGSSSAATCPYGNSFADGCAGANPNSVFQISKIYGVDLRTYATGSSYIGNDQTWSSAHPQPFNVAGADFPVAFYTPQASLLNPHTNIPPGCGYNTGTGFMGNAPYIRCNISGSQNLDIEGYDFGAENGMQLVISGNTTGTVTVKNNRLACGTAVCGGGVTGGLLYVMNGSGAASWYIGFNMFDGGDGHTSTLCGGSRCTTNQNKLIQIYNSNG